MNSGIFGVHLRRRAIVRRVRHRQMVPDVAAFDPADVAAGALDHQHLGDIRAFGQRFVAIGLERNLFAAAHTFVGRDDIARIAILDAAGEAVGREAAEHHRMDRADARTGQHGVSRFGNHRHIDGDTVAFLDAVRLHHVGELADLAVQLFVGDARVLLGIVAFPDDRRLVATRLEMSIKAIGRGVELAVLVPLDADVAAEGRVLDLRVGPDPVEPFAVIAPELVRVLIDSAYIFS